MKGNVIVGQSGGPTAAINSSLAGVYRTAKDRGANKVYGMLHGIQGLMQERYIDMADYIKTELDAELLKRTPAAFLGSLKSMKAWTYTRKFSRFWISLISKLSFISAAMTLWIPSRSFPITP